MEQKSAIENLVDEWSRRHTVQLRIESYAVSIGRPNIYTLVLNGILRGSRLDIVHNHGTTAMVDLASTMILKAVDAPEVLAEKYVGVSSFYDGQLEPHLKNEPPCMEAQVALPRQTIESISRLLPLYDQPTFTIEVDGVEDRNGTSVWDVRASPKLAILTASFGVLSENKANSGDRVQIELLAKNVAAISTQLRQEGVKVRLF